MLHLQCCTLSCLFVLFSFLTPPLGLSDDLRVLLEDYREFGLPLPGQDAQLAMQEFPGTFTVNGVRQHTCHLLLLTGRSAASQRMYLAGTKMVTPERGETVRVVPPTVDSLAATKSYTPPWWQPHLPTFPDLALAIQCKSLGWEELAKAALDRSRRRKNEYYEWNRRPRNDRDALALMAWNHYCTRFAEATASERKLILDRMKRLLNDRRIINAPVRRLLIGDFERTLEPAASANGLEAAIESLLELDGTAHGRLEKIVNSNAACRSILDAGLVAIPALLRHLNDFRVTRLILSEDDNRCYSGYVWNVRVADVAAHLLERLAGEEFAYDFLQSEGRGRRLDQNHVTHWWNLTKEKGVLPPPLGDDKRQSSDRTPLQEAAELRDVQRVRTLLEAGAVLDFDTAVQLGWTEEVAAMLKDQPWLAKLPRKPLPDAIRRGDRRLVFLLLDHGADPNSDPHFMNFNGPYPPITVAVTSNDFESTKALLQRGADPNVGAGRNHDNLLIYAVAYRDPYFVEAILHSGADVHSTTSWGVGVSPLHVAASLGGGVGAMRVERWGQPRRPDTEELMAIEKASLLLASGADPNARTSDRATPLLFAALAGNDKVCELLLKSGAKLDFYSACALARRVEVMAMLDADPGLMRGKLQPLQRSPLHLAAVGGDPVIVGRLLELGADPNAAAPVLEFQDASGFAADGTESGEVPLHVAAMFGHEEIVRQLIEAGAELEARTIGYEGRRGATPLELACTHDRPTAVKELLAKGAKVIVGGSSLLYAAVDHHQVLELLLDSGRSTDLAGEHGTSLLASAVEGGNDKSIQLLLARGARPDIFSASILGQTEVVKQLLEQDPSFVHATRETYPFHAIVLAAQHGHTEIVKLLKDSGAPLSSYQLDGWSLPHEAARWGQKETLQWLFTQKFRPSSRDADGATVLHAAAEGARPEIVQFLLSLGADAQAVDSSGKPVLSAIADDSLTSDPYYEQPTTDRIAATVRLMIRAGADVNAHDNYGWTPLHEAASRGLTEACELLLDAGADVNARTEHYETPLRRAMSAPDISLTQRNAKPVIALLRSRGGHK